MDVAISASDRRGGTGASDVGPVLVTAATGNVGRSAARALFELGVPIRLGVRRPHDPIGGLTGRAGGSGPACEPIALDFSDPATFGPAVDGIRGLVLIRPPAIAEVRTTLLALAERAASAGCRQIVFLSVLGAGRKSWIPHYKIERGLEEIPVDRTFLRAGFFCQNLVDAYRRDIVEDGRIYVPAGEGRVAWVDARDLGEAAARAFVDPSLRGACPDLVGPEAIGFARAAAIVSSALGRPVRYEPASALGYARHLRKRGLPWMRIAIQSLLHLGLRRGDADRQDPALERILGRPPRRLSDYVRDHAADLR